MSKIFSSYVSCKYVLTHWGRATHVCVGNLTTIGSDNGLSPDRRQAIIWTNAGILLIGPLKINFSEISMEIQTSSFRKMRLKSSSAKWRPSCLGLTVLIVWFAYVIVCKTGRHPPAHGAAISRRTCPSEGLAYWPQTRPLELCSGGNWCYMWPDYYNCTSVLVMEIIGALLKSYLFNSSHLVWIVCIRISHYKAS